MKQQMKDIGKKVLKSDHIVFTFMRSIVSSQAASIVDLAIGFVMFAFVGINPFLATAIGAVSGGIVNCIINYKFTFHASECSWRAVIVKYSMVWVGSLLLNSFGTDALYNLLKSWTWLEDLGFKPDGYYAAARLITSLLVSWFWNFLLQRHFVYRINRFDPVAIRITNFFYPSKNKSSH